MFGALSLVALCKATNGYGYMLHFCLTVWLIDSLQKCTGQLLRCVPFPWFQIKWQWFVSTRPPWIVDSARAHLSRFAENPMSRNCEIICFRLGGEPWGWGTGAERVLLLTWLMIYFSWLDFTLHSERFFLRWFCFLQIECVRHLPMGALCKVFERNALWIFQRNITFL